MLLYQLQAARICLFLRAPIHHSAHFECKYIAYAVRGLKLLTRALDFCVYSGATLEVHTLSAILQRL